MNRILTCTPEEYHQDPCEVPSLSASIAHILLTQSPLHAYHAHPRLGRGAHKVSDEFDNGDLYHALLLGKGKKVRVIQAENYRTKAAQEERDIARASGYTPVLAAKYEEAKRIADILADQFPCELDGKSELPITFTVDGVQCRSMLDHVFLDSGIIYDVKTISSAHPDKCEDHVGRYGYDIQYAAYTSALAAVRPEFEGRVDMAFLFCETDPPYAVTEARLSGAYRQRGALRWRRAVSLWKACLESENWPSYVRAGESVILEPKPWMMTEEITNDEITNDENV